MGKPAWLSSRDAVEPLPCTLGALSSMDAPCIASGSDEFMRNIGLAVIYPAFDAVGDRWPWWNPRIGAPSRYRALALVHCLGLGRSRLPCFAITSSSPSQSRY